MSSTEAPQAQPAQQQLVYPQFVLDRIAEVSKLTGTTTDELKTSYEAIFHDPWIQKDPQFKSDDERHKYSVARLWSRNVGRAQLDEFDVIPVGMAAVRISKKGATFASLFVIMKDAKTKAWKLNRISFNKEEVTSKLAGINMFNGYKVPLGRFQGTDDLICDKRTQWENPRLLGSKTPREILEMVKAQIEVVPLDKYSSHTSKRQGGQKDFIDSLDWKVVRGLIREKRDGVRDDGTPWAQYVIGDESTGTEIVAPDGSKTTKAGLTVWCDKSVHGFVEEDECDFYGTIEQSKKDASIAMNAYMILPVHARPQETSA